jgi:hypothetical protein
MRGRGAANFLSTRGDDSTKGSSTGRTPTLQANSSLGHRQPVARCHGGLSHALVLQVGGACCISGSSCPASLARTELPLPRSVCAPLLNRLWACPHSMFRTSDLEWTTARSTRQCWTSNLAALISGASPRQAENAVALHSRWYGTAESCKSTALTLTR